MKVRIERTRNGNVYVFADHSDPICYLWEDDFQGMLTDAQYLDYQRGKTEFEVSRRLLERKSIIWY